MSEAQNAKARHELLTLPYERKWEYLRPTIIKLFVEENMPMKAMVEHMKKEFNFSAQPSHYKYQLKKWGAKKRTTSQEKDGIVSILGKRGREDTSTDDVTISNRDGSLSKKVDKKQLLRYLKARDKQDQTMVIMPGVFARWNLPYDALVASKLQSQASQSSPFGHGPATPANLAVASPNESSSPGASRSDPSPATQLVRRTVLRDRSILFLTGQQDSLLSGASPADGRTITTYLNHFWIRNFVTAKYWGRGPEHWNAAMISFKTLGPPEALPSPQPGDNIVASPHRTMLAQYHSVTPPTQLCRWSIHVRHERYEAVPSQGPGTPTQEPYDIEDESSWPAWRMTETRPTLGQSMLEALASNDFTDISAQEVPLSATTIVKAAQASPRQIEIEALAFAIMSGNQEQVETICNRMAELNNHLPSIETRNFIDLAISHMNAAANCCQILNLVDGWLSIWPQQANEIGLTFLDSLLVNIIRSHTGIEPRQVSEHFENSRFPGEDRDICGRWDADSPCVQRLLLSGITQVPLEWKHAFCHTSVQGICHAINMVVDSNIAEDLGSGLFIRNCQNCSKRLKPGPLHSLVLVAFHLAQNGRTGETLFGALACLLELLRVGVNPFAKFEVSVNALVQNLVGRNCDHERMDASDMTYRVPNQLISSWPDDVQIGWKVFSRVLQHAKDAQQKYSQVRVHEEQEDEEREVEESWDERSQNDSLPSNIEDICEECGEQRCCFKSNKLLMIWRTVQAELTTYRRISENDPWLSPNFDMRAILSWLDGTTKELDMPFLTRKMIRMISACLENRHDFPRADEICVAYCMNMKDRHRTSFI